MPTCYTLTPLTLFRKTCIILLSWQAYMLAFAMILYMTDSGRYFMIRFILVATFVILFLILSIPILIAEWMIGKKNPQLKSTSSQAIVTWAFRVCLFIAGTSVTVIGKENIPTDTAVLYVGNHRSYFDILLTYDQAIRSTGCVAKIEMKRYPLLSDWMRNIHCTFLDRTDLKKGMATIKENIELLKNGVSINVYPEGTRNKTQDTLLPFHDGSLKMAERSGCPIVPVTMNNTGAIFEDHLPKIQKQHVVIEYGKPIYMNQMSREEKKLVSDNIQTILTETYEKNKALV